MLGDGGLALEQLGFEPCFQTKEFFAAENGEALKARWEDLAFEAAARGEAEGRASAG